MINPALDRLHPHMAQAFAHIFKPSTSVTCQHCGTSGDPAKHSKADCKAQLKHQHDAGYLRAAQVIKQVTEAERAADDIEANVNKAAKAHEHQLCAGLRDQINDKTGAYQ